MSSRSILPWLLLLVLLPLHSLLAAGITDARWKGNDFVMTFADSIGYTVDLSESDSTKVVLRLTGVEPGANYLQRKIEGPARTAALLTSDPGGLRMTITSTDRLGYSTIWHPYSNRLVVHTFDWDKLSYGEEQYHKGLLAFEGRYSIAAEEMLKVAEATGETRARSALGVWYLGRGDDSLAARYLDSAVTADDHAALAEVRRRRGDTLTATREAEIARMMIADEIRTAAPAPPQADEETPAPTNRGVESRAQNEAYYLGGGLLALLLLIGAIIYFTRKPNVAVNVAEGRIAPKRSTTPVTTPAPVVTGTTIRDPEPVPVPEPIPVSTVTTPVHETAPVVEAAPEPIVVATPHVDPTPVEPSNVEAMPVEEAITSGRFPSVTTVEELEPLEESEPEIAPIVTRHPVADSRPIDPEPTPEEPLLPTADAEPTERPGRRLPSQAAALERKIKSVRRDAPAPSEPTVYAARRLNVSRDNVELRKKMDAARRGQE